MTGLEGIGGLAQAVAMYGAAGISTYPGCIAGIFVSQKENSSNSSILLSISKTSILFIIAFAVVVLLFSPDINVGTILYIIPCIPLTLFSGYVGTKIGIWLINKNIIERFKIVVIILFSLVAFFGVGIFFDSIKAGIVSLVVFLSFSILYYIYICKSKFNHMVLNIFTSLFGPAVYFTLGFIVFWVLVVI